MGSALKEVPGTGVRAWAPAFVAAFAAMFLYALANQQLPFRGDAHETWQVAKALADPAQPYRSFVEYRGFVVFVLNAAIYRLSTLSGIDGVLAFRFFSSLLFAALSAAAWPDALGRLTGTAPTLARRLACVALAFVFFRGYFLYPSNDPVALFFLLLALNAVNTQAPPSAGRAAIAGLWLGAAILSRSNYIVAVPFVAWLAIARNGAFAPQRRVAVARGALLVAMLGAMFAANAGYGAYRERVAGSAHTDGRRVLNGQLTNGLRMQRIEWNAGDGSYPGMPTFGEERGRAILAEEGRASGWLHAHEYFAIAFRHPFDFAVIYARHLFNGLDLAYPTVYVPDVRRRSLLFSVSNFTLIFLALVALGRNFRSLRQLPALLAIGLPALACVPFPVEPRFFMSLSMFLHAYPVFASPWRRGRHDRRVLALSAALFVAACLAVSAHVFGTLEGAPLPFHTLP